jgi:UPF0755 protein
VVHSERDSLVDQDPHALLFGHDDDGEQAESPESPDGHGHEPRRQTRLARARTARRRHGRRAFAVLSAIVLVIVLVVAFTGYRLYEDRYHPKDYAGAGTGSVLVKITDGATAGAIGQALVADRVVASARAFQNAAAANPASQELAPGTYRLREHMSARNALSLLLDPSARVSNGVVVFEGATVLDVIGPLAKALGVDTAQARAAIDNLAALGLPSGYAGPNGPPSSVEGFLYPATYNFDPGTGPTDAVQEMISKFILEDRATGFAAKAQAEHLTPYQALIIASIAEKEAKMPADYAKVARVILNRIAAGMPLQIDATSAYAAKLANLDPTKVIYATIDSPYNSYTHPGLPPTPISNPGEAALEAAVAPASGNWLYYVNGDAQGDLYFTASQTEFAKAAEKCQANNWGCG